MIDHLDFHVGRLLERLNELGLSENTIVVFMSDNGPISNAPLMPGGQRVRLSEEEWKLRNPGNYRGNKATNWENGVKSPLFIQWGSKIDPGVSNRLVDVTDILPTLLEATGSRLLPEAKPVDGKSFWPVITTDNPSWEAGDVYFSRWWPSVNGGKQSAKFMPVTPEDKENLKYEEQFIGIRDQEYKFLMENGRKYLFHIPSDSTESFNLMDEKPEIADSLEARLMEWCNEIVSLPSTFESPVNLVGFNKAGVSRFYAYSSYEVSKNLINDAFDVRGWSGKGDQSSYFLRVENKGKYSITLEGRGLSEKLSEYFVLVVDRKEYVMDKSFTTGKIKFKSGEYDLKIRLKKSLPEGTSIRFQQFVFQNVKTN